MMTASGYANFIYDLFAWTFLIIFDIFFRDVKTRGAFNIPSQGPVILVVAPHSNQFVDPLMVLIQTKKSTGRRISFLMAAAYYRKKFIGDLARLTRVIPVERAQDGLKPASGTIHYADFEKDPCLIEGTDTKFTQECDAKGLIGLPRSGGFGKIAEVLSDTLLRLHKPFSSDRAIKIIKGSTTYKTAPKIDNSMVFKHVFDHLHSGGILGIFPEGGSHDRTELLPLQPGVALMALGALAENSEQPITIVPCGLNYFHPNKFRSRAVVEYGSPIVVGEEQARAYKEDSRKAVAELLKTISTGLKTVTVQCEDYETLMILQAARRLYQYPKKKIPLPLVVQMNRNLTIGYTKFKDLPEIVHLKNSVQTYNYRLNNLGLKDHQVQTVKFKPFKAVALLAYRLVKLLILAVLSLPGTVLFSPVFIACKYISHKKAREALANSVVKIRANDVLATWKLMVAMVATPCLYAFYSTLGTFLIFKYDIAIVPYQTKSIVVTFITAWIILVCTTYAAFRIGEIGMDTLKSIKYLTWSLFPSEALEELKAERDRLSLEVTEVCNNLGPKVIPEFAKDLEKIGASNEEQEEEGIEDEEKEQLLNKTRLGRAPSTSSVNSLRSVTSGTSMPSELGEVAIFSELPTSSRGSIRSRSSSLSESETTGLSTGIEANNVRSKIQERIFQKMRNEAN
ncbi:hypothetical protein LJB42_000667 [Komagataella kurtzmanii]|nr:hypothetical protein LJB42_000667 [Komagataella kurtzmanii]